MRCRSRTEPAPHPPSHAASKPALRCSRVGVSLVRRSSIAALASLLALAVLGLACLPSDAGAWSRSQARYLRAADQGVKQTDRWWNRGRHWYSSVLGGRKVVSLWGVVPLFEALNGLQIA